MKKAEISTLQPPPNTSHKYYRGSFRATRSTKSQRVSVWTSFHLSLSQISPLLFCCWYHSLLSRHSVVFPFLFVGVIFSHLQLYGPATALRPAGGLRPLITGCSQLSDRFPPCVKDTKTFGFGSGSLTPCNKVGQQDFPPLPGDLTAESAAASPVVFLLSVRERESGPFPFRFF